MKSNEAQHFSVDLRKNLQCDANMLLFLSSGYMFSSILFTAVELGLFDTLEQNPGTCHSVASRLKLPEDSTERLLLVLLAMGLVTKNEKNMYQNSTVSSEILLSESPKSVCAFLLHQQRHFYDLFGHLSDAIRTQKPQFSHWKFLQDKTTETDCYQALVKHPEEYKLFLKAMNLGSAGTGNAMVGQVDFAPIKHLLDLGGGGGQVAFELLENVSHLSITTIDYPQACEFMKTQVKDKSYADRLRLITGNILQEGKEFYRTNSLDANIDAILLSGVLADWTAEQQTKMLTVAYEILPKGALLLISETLFSPEKKGPLLPALLSLSMLVATQGKNLTLQELEQRLQSVGFQEIHLFSGQELGIRDLVTARKPL